MKSYQVFKFGYRVATVFLPAGVKNTVATEDLVGLRFGGALNVIQIGVGSYRFSPISVTEFSRSAPAGEWINGRSLKDFYCVT